MLEIFKCERRLARANVNIGDILRYIRCVEAITSYLRIYTAKCVFAWHTFLILNP